VEEVDKEKEEPKEEERWNDKGTFCKKGGEDRE